MTTHLASLIPFIIVSMVLLLALHRTSLLMALLTLETIILSIILLTTMQLSPAYQPNSFFILILLTLGACEASLGLAILIAMARSFGNDQVSSLTTSKC